MSADLVLWKPTIIKVLEDAFLWSDSSLLLYFLCWGLCCAISACYISSHFLSGRHCEQAQCRAYSCQKKCKKKAETSSWGWSRESGIMAEIRSTLVPPVHWSPDLPWTVFYTHPWKLQFSSWTLSLKHKFLSNQFWNVAPDKILVYLLVLSQIFLLACLFSATLS